MQLHQLQPSHKLKKAKPRIGRGGKRGTYSGRGQKGQKAHAGRRIKPAVYDLISKLPKLRGYRNTPKSPKPLAINVGDLNKIEGDVINKKTLRVKRDVKILGNGEISRAVKVEGLKVSKVAREKIEKAGGHVS